MQLKSILNRVEPLKSFVYAMQRVNCPSCGGTGERVPWATGKVHLTTS